MSGKDLMSTLRRFDAYPKTLEDFRVKTFGGAAGECYVIITVAEPRFFVWENGVVVPFNWLTIIFEKLDVKIGGNF